MRRVVVVACLFAARAAYAVSPPATPPAAVTPLSVAAFRAELDAARGQVLILNLWASWCAPCLKEIPVLLEMERRYASCGVRLIGLATDDPSEFAGPVTSMHARYFPTFRTFAQTEGEPDSYAAVIDPAWNELMPTTYVIGRDGRVVRRVQGGKTADEFARAVEAAAPCNPSG